MVKKFSFVIPARIKVCFFSWKKFYSNFIFLLKCEWCIEAPLYDKIKILKMLLGWGWSWWNIFKMIHFSISAIPIRNGTVSNTTNKCSDFLVTLGISTNPVYLSNLFSNYFTSIYIFFVVTSTKIFSHKNSQQKYS